MSTNTEVVKSPPRPAFESFYFCTGLGYVCYYFLRNDWIWSRLSSDEREFVLRQNEYWNNHNPGYDNPESYQGQGGRSFHSLDCRESGWQGCQLGDFLAKARPSRVLEIGPGSGYFTRQIFDCESVVEYVATDINAKFLEFIKEAAYQHPRHAAISRSFVPLRDLDSTELQVDAIVLLSTLHHIPDRQEFIKDISRFLRPGGQIFFYEPTHSLARVVQLGWSFLLHRWFLTGVVRARNNVMTHHFCTVGETRGIAHHAGLSLIDWKVESKLPVWLRRVAAPFSRKMVAVLKKPN